MLKYEKAVIHSWWGNMLAERAESRSRADAALANLLRDAPAATSTNSNDDGPSTMFSEPEEISARILKKIARDLTLPTEAHGAGSTYQTNMRITITAVGHGDIQTGIVEPIVVLFPTVKRSENTPSTHTIIFGRASGFGVTENTEENVP
jgi:hypothetical protein